jgi:hypothetical protein
MVKEKMRNNNTIICKVTLLFLLCVYFFTPVKSNAAPDKGPLEIKRVGLDQKSFNPSKGETAALGFDITSQADVRVIIYDRLGREVRSYYMSDLEPARHTVTWDGRRSDGWLASGDVFLYVIEAEGKDGKRVIHNPANKTGGIETKSLKYTVDRETGEITYVLPKACMIRIRAGLKDGMFGKSLFDWMPSTAGRHTYMWDGKDSSGWMNLLKNHHLSIRLTCYTLPTNTVIVTGQIVPLESKNNPESFNTEEWERLWGTKGKYLHYAHDPRICHQPRFKVLFPTGAEEKSDLVRVSGIVPIRIELDKRDARHLINTRFEVMIFVDGVFLYEIEEGSSPFTFNWDTKVFTKGPHIVTVNVVGYDDHIGILSRKVFLGE